MSFLNEKITYERPVQPRPTIFAFKRALDRWEQEELRRDRQRLQRILKREIASLLADHIVANCQFFNPTPVDSIEGPMVRMEVSVGDQGSYANWLPEERARGKVEGVVEGAKAVRNTIPYGVEPGLYYE